MVGQGSMPETPAKIGKSLNFIQLRRVDMDTGLLDRWAKRLQNLTVSHLPSDYSRPSPPRLVEAALSRAIDAEVQLSLFRLAIHGTDDSQVTTPFTILLSAFIVLVQRLTGDEDISIGTSSEGGDPFVLRCGISPSDSFSSLLRKVKQVDLLIFGLTNALDRDRRYLCSCRLP